MSQCDLATIAVIRADELNTLFFGRGQWSRSKLEFWPGMSPCLMRLLQHIPTPHLAKSLGPLILNAGATSGLARDQNVVSPCPRLYPTQVRYEPATTMMGFMSASQAMGSAALRCRLRGVSGCDPAPPRQ